jgi:serine/threonine protein kinase
MSDTQAQLEAALAGRYAIERELGRGGMATVYLARDLRHDRPVALKVLHAELGNTLGPARFQREIQLAARLQHPHILTVLDSGEAVVSAPQTNDDTRQTNASPETSTVRIFGCCRPAAS